MLEITLDLPMVEVFLHGHSHVTQVQGVEVNGVMILKNFPFLEIKVISIANHLVVYWTCR